MRIVPYALLAILPFLAPLARSLPAQVPLVVPRGAAPVIDGSLGAAEWHDALVVRLAGAGDLLFRHDDRYLYVAIRASQPGFASICIANVDTVSVLQAPSALGAARYVKTGKGWTLASGFDWQLRGNTLDAARRAERQRYLDENGWLASTKQMGSRQKELQIALDRLPAGEIPIALVYRTDDGPSWHWPANLSDGCASLMLVAGIDVNGLAFAPQRWTMLTLSGRRQGALRTALAR